MNKLEITFMLNGKETCIDVDPEMTLLNLLREELLLTGTKEGCGGGECGACTVLMDGIAVNSCLILAAQVNGTEIITIEALEHDVQLDRLQQSFIDNHAVQCGFCTPGMLMSSKALLLKNPRPTEEEIKIALSGNLCRCTGYKSIIAAVEGAIEE
ncbi:(2Fe-2S)-binding protein [Clostridium magnum]|uniref:Nicotinate dehydrogenase small FeS subunit n=1 Tax=Clostridium magnum DSM 2767 TaxID=1121326 RepID=A0A161YGH4_9CLOT|nr:(2Fe-2S)-binding protein [Clostridium magnum]KZL89252.1 nicotinate dehydrogenase small FeS subunit [Clostridium magnum DSM 2767]SHI97496.1 carbon-monoxide dehydrogenase small subunit [Clostridium magnum DSM 2767]